MTPFRPPPYAPGTNPALQRRFTLTPQLLRFVEEFLISLDPNVAARRAGLPAADGPRLLATRSIQEAISFHSRRALSRQQIYLEDTLRNLVALRDFNPNELVEVRRKPCRHCYGDDHEFQYTDIEFRLARAKHRNEQLVLPEENRVPFDEKGGPGYTTNRLPMRGPDWAEQEDQNQDPPPQPNGDHSCPACFGHGELFVIIKDTRNLSLGARLAYDGVKVGNGGAVEVKIRDRNWAEDRIARYAGMFNDRRAPTDPNRMNDEQLVDAVVSLVERGTVEFEALPLPTPTEEETE
jgi:phage terminase small subunit